MKNIFDFKEAALSKEEQERHCGQTGGGHYHAYAGPIHFVHPVVPNFSFFFPKFHFNFGPFVQPPTITNTSFSSSSTQGKGHGVSVQVTNNNGIVKTTYKEWEW